jgi:hypothetical protein
MVWELASIMAGTVNNHGMSAQIISIIQMLQAWVSVTVVSNMLQGITKVTMVAQTSTMTTNRTAMDTIIKATASAAGVEVVATATVAWAVAVTAMATMTTSNPKDCRMARLLEQ